MTAARWRGVDYDIINFTDSGEYVLRGTDGDIVVTDGLELDRRTVEVRCERCGRFHCRRSSGRLPGDGFVTTARHGRR